MTRKDPSTRSVFSDTRRHAWPFLAGLAACTVLGSGGAARAESLDEAKARAAEALRSWDIAEAGRALDGLVEHGSDPDVGHLRAQWSFLRGRYDEAVAGIEAAIEVRPTDKVLLGARDLFRDTRDTVKDFKEVPSAGGHFVMAFRPGPDEVLIPYAGAALESAYATLGEIFRYHPQEPVRVEIYPSVSDLAEVSPLKESEIRTSGTIALCKYNRIMAVSPRALVYGYRWLDTLAHEYIHLLIARRSRNRVPIWLHEGMAKFFENRWRETTNATLRPASEDLLVRALRKKKLIRFEAMSPSMAMLPSQEDTALAFAEVFMVMELLYERGGSEAALVLVDAMRDGESDRDAVAKVMRKSFKRFEREWQAYLYQRNLRTLPTFAHARLLFQDKARPKDELDDIPEERARRLTYLGDRLAVRQRYQAASVEYGKAIQSAGGPNPLIAAKLASALLSQGMHQQVPKVVDPALKLNPDHVLLYLYRGKARLAVGEYEEARRDLVEAVRLNPFDPEVHGLLAKALAGLGHKDEAEREERNQRLVNAE